MSKVGKSEIRVDAFDMATGRTKYYEDRMPAGALYARIKHATIAHGYVKSIDKSAAEAIEGVVKVLVFLTYLILCSKQKDVHRVFCYHGAEHKTIFCYEAGLPLTVENARIQPRHHPRCGTSFLFVVIVVSILFSSVAFTYVEWQNLWVRIGMHLLLLVPVVCRPAQMLRRRTARKRSRRKRKLRLRPSARRMDFSVRTLSGTLLYFCVH